MSDASAGPNDLAIDWTLVARYLANELPADERQRFEQWVDGDVRRADELAEIRRLWSGASALPSPSRLRGMWTAIARGIQDQSVGAQPADDARPAELHTEE